MVTRKTLVVLVSPKRDLFLVEPDEETIKSLKLWLYMNARRDQYFYDKVLGLYVLDTELMGPLSDDFALKKKTGYAEAAGLGGAD